MPRAIPIPVVAAETPSAAASHPRSDPVPGAKFAQASRRRFLKGSSMLAGVLVAGSPLALLAPGRAWALELVHLNQHQADAIMALAKTLYPHAGLPDAVYALVVKDVDAQAGDAKTAGLINSGVARLEHEAGGKWLSASAAQRTVLVTAHQSDPFVQMVRAQCITSLYDNDMAYAYFGYEGESFSKGGYLHRGFDDLQWLPNPPAQASPPAA